MRTRYWISLAAILGVLLHAGIVVRHATMMLERTLLQGQLAAALGVICHSDGSISSGDANSPIPPSPNGNGTDCPYCHGALGASAILPTPTVLQVPAHAPSARMAILTEQVAERLAGLHPPPRGPPASI